MEEPEKITIIEGPSPTFELVNDTWLLGLTEGPVSSQVALCRVRTQNGPALVERCYAAWHRGQAACLEFRSEEGLTRQSPIVGVRASVTDEGEVLHLWIRLHEGEMEVDPDLEVDEIDDEYDDAQDSDPDLSI
ncbi:MAG: hypothetical protein WD040_00415 [Anaerolineales bacterium]